MNFIKINFEAGKILGFLDSQNLLKPEEKIAVLRAAASTIEQVLAAESLVVLMANMLTKK